MKRYLCTQARYVRSSTCKTPESFALAYGISVEDAEKCLEVAMDPTTPRDANIALEKTKLDNGLIIGPGNVLGSW